MMRWRRGLDRWRGTPPLSFSTEGNERGGSYMRIDVGHYAGTGGLHGLCSLSSTAQGSNTIDELRPLDIEQSAVKGRTRAARNRCWETLQALQEMGSISTTQIGKTATEALANLDAAEPLSELPPSSPLWLMVSRHYILARLGYWEQAAWRLRQIHVNEWRRHGGSGNVDPAPDPAA